jgi:hypothetical protein
MEGWCVMYIVRTGCGKKFKGKKALLDLAIKYGTRRFDYSNGDSVYFHETGSRVAAGLVWLYFRLVGGVSAQWTYIVKVGCGVNLYGNDFLKP